ncbi:MAG TPA: FHA domain-containing protein, partial [Candidatus Binatus sp.]|nr:FHA domain-containing protein [Candidatus Binatus sp.]
PQPPVASSELGIDNDSDSTNESDTTITGNDELEQPDEDLEESLKVSEALDTEKESEDFEASTVITSPLSSGSVSSNTTSSSTVAVSSAEEEDSQDEASLGPSDLSLTSRRLYLVFVNTPAQSLVKSRVGIEFDVFKTVSIGRNPENVVVVPDQEVSRKHAELTLERGKVMLRDLKSANGTFVYDGKQFQRVNGSVEVKPNNILKFGSGTIVRLVSE